jgi:poly(A) polymerase
MSTVFLVVLLGYSSSLEYVSYTQMPLLEPSLAGFSLSTTNGLLSSDSRHTYIYNRSSRSWPQPVLLKQIEEGPLQVRVWNPKVWTDLTLLVFLLIYLAAVPFRPIPPNAHNHPRLPCDVRHSQCHNLNTNDHHRGVQERFAFQGSNWVKSHLYAGNEIVNRVIVGTAEWSQLFAKHDFFHRYRYYLQIIASTNDPDLHIKWCV